MSAIGPETQLLLALAVGPLMLLYIAWAVHR
jgi:hypothetical protein